MFFIIASIVIAIVSVILVIAIALQESKSYGLSSSLSGGTDGYFSGSKSKTKDGKLAKITLVAGIAFIVIAILLNVSFFTGL